LIETNEAVEGEDVIEKGSDLAACVAEDCCLCEYSLANILKLFHEIMRDVRVYCKKTKERLGLQKPSKHHLSL
jgi:hypothetical protein